MVDAGSDEATPPTNPDNAATVDVRRSDGVTALAGVPAAVIAAAAFALYLAFARLGSIWSHDVLGPTALAPAAGVGVGVMFITRRATWPTTVAAVAVASVAHDAVFVDPSVTEHLVLVSARVTGQIAIIAIYAWAFGTSRLDFELRSVLGVAAPALALLLPSTIVASFLEVDELTRTEIWVTWLVGESVGMIAVTLLLAVFIIPFQRETARYVSDHAVEAVVTSMAIVAIGIVSFTTTTPLVLVLIPLCGWLAYRMSNWLATPVTVFLVFFGTARTDRGAGPFVDFDHALLWLQLLNLVLLFFVISLGRAFWSDRYGERRYQAILALLPDEITIHDRRGDLLEQLATTAPAESPGIDEIAERWDSMIADGLPATRVVHTDDDGGRDLEIRLIPVGSDAVMSVVRDVTDEQALLHELERAGEHWKRMAATAYEGFIEVGPDQRVTHVSDRWAEMHGLSPSEIVGTSFRELFAPDDWQQFRPYAYQVFGGAHVTFEYAHTGPDGERRWALTSADGQVDSAGRFQGFVCFAGDTTELHRAISSREAAELRLATLERRERERIAAFLHDGPLQSMVALGYRLNSIKAGADPAAAAADLERMALDAIADMREGLTELSPSEIGDGQLGEALRSATARFGDPERRAKVLVDDRLTSDVDLESASTLFLIGREAITNAVLHAHASTIRVTIGPFGGGYRLDVADNGIGLPAAESKDNGRLGMRSMYRRAQEVGGRCDVRPNEPEGTRVIVWIPDLAQPARSEGASASGSESIAR